jgi:NAD(P)H-hydrate epimerase
MPLPILTVEQMRVWERATWSAGISEAHVIAQVGRSVAAKVREMVPVGSRVVMLAGKGNNGNDVRAAMPHLVSPAGFPEYELTLLEISDPAAAQPELERVLAGGSNLIVDGLFGIGLNRPLSSEWCRLIETVNSSGLTVLAVDVPSGLDADTGAHFGTAIRAAVTLTVGAPKRGHVETGASDFVGRLEVAAEVGLLPNPELVVGGVTDGQVASGWPFPLAWSVAGDFGGIPPRRRVNSHKGTYGHLVVVAGSLGYHGAAVLAAKAAGAARPGLVTVITSPEVYPAVAAQLAFAMVRTWNEPLALPAKATAVLIGPGLAGRDVPDWLRIQTQAWWRESPLPLVVDASALDWLAAEHRQSNAPIRGDGLGNPAAPATETHEGTNRPRVGGPIRVITPHPGEAQRWLEPGRRELDCSRETLLNALNPAGIVVLKGHQTLIREGSGPTFLNPTGNPGLAQGGTGDVLAGFLGGLLAQPALQRDPLLTTRYAVWEHGAAADRLESVRRNWTAEHLAAEIGR